MPLETNLAGRVALLTGASRGIGKHLALRLAREKIRLVLTATRVENLGTVLERIRGQGGEATGLAVDLTDPGQVLDLARTSVQVYSGLDILINNAGIGFHKPLLETSHEEWAHCFALNSTAPFLLCRELIPILSRSDHATILNIASVVAHKGYLNQGAYSASKHALLGMTKVLAQEVQPLGIRVHALCPGGVATEMISEMRPDLDPAGLIQPEELAEWVVFLLSNRGSAVVDDLHLRRASGAPWF